MKGKVEHRLPEALMFETGANRWRSFDAWPSRRAREETLYLRAGGVLGREPPADAGDEMPGEGEGRGRPRNRERTLDLEGIQSLVRAEVFRGRFRESYERPKPFEPGEVTKVAFELQDVLHTWKRGHRMMIQIRST